MLTCRHPLPAGARRSRAARCAGALVAVSAFAWPAPAASPYAKGEEVRIAGRVTDADGNAVADMAVTLLATGRNHPLWRATAPRRVAERATRTDDDGTFEIRWPWQRGYDRFELRLGGGPAAGDGAAVPPRQQVDITDRVLAGGPIAVPVTLPADAADAASFAGGVATEDERRVFAELGRPDRVDREGAEADWWYFERGRVARFRDGRLLEIEEFEPVRPF